VAALGLGPGDGRLVEERDFVPEGVLLEVAAVVLAAIFRGEADPKGRANLFEFANPADDLEFAEALHDPISCSLRGSMTNARGRDGLRSTAKSEGPLHGNRICG
jgi:hypothetical protein